MTSAELLQQQLNSSKRKRKGVKMDVQNGIDYNAELHRIVSQVNRDVMEHIMPLVKALETQYTADTSLITRDGWADVLIGALEFVKGRWDTSEFKTLTQEIANKFVRTANATNEKRNSTQIGVNVYGGDTTIQEYLKASAYDNARLIKSIPEQYLTQVESIVLTNIRAGGLPSAISEQLEIQLGVTQRRAKFIARDQTAKINGDLNAKRQQAAGFEYFQWVDSNDERVRDRHAFIADKITAYGKGIYRWDDPPLNERGVPIIPGSDYGCRCTARPVSQREVDANVKTGKTVNGVYR